MPVRMQPARIDQPHPHLWPLPVPFRAPGCGSLNAFSRAAQTAAIRSASSGSVVARCAWSASTA